MIADPRFTAEEKFQEARRELTLRQLVYDKWILAGKMTREKADRQIALMHEICSDYEELAKKERLL